MTIKPIRTEEDYRLALKRASYFFDNEPQPGTAEQDEFEILLTLLDAYETEHFPIAAPDPIEAIKFRMEQKGLVVNDLVSSIGKPNRVYEVLAGKRKLTLPMIRRLHQNLGIPFESLMGAG